MIEENDDALHTFRERERVNRPAGRTKLLIIGIDSATFDLITPMREAGDLPHLSRLIEGGCWGKLQSTIPPVTPPAWVSFMTGKNPGKHGVFDFYVSSSYGYARPVWNSRYIKAKTLWRLLSEHGITSGVVNLPMTFPPEKIKGFIIPGMQYSFDGEDFSHPPELMEEIRTRIGEYRVMYGDMESLYTNNLDKLISEWRDIFEVRRRTILYLIEEKQWDVFMAVFYSIDVMQHHFWKFFDSAHPLYDAGLASRYGDIIPEFYRRIDSAIGDILERTGEDIPVLILSDHGAGPEEESFSVNNWLCEQGFLHFRKAYSPLWLWRFPHLLYKTLRRMKFGGISWTVPLDRLKTLGGIIDPREGLNIPFFIDWGKTRAYGGNHTEQGIYINLRGREPLGIVEEGSEYEKVRETIIEKLKNIRDPLTQKPLDITVYRKEEIYQGPYLHEAPDIFMEIKGGRCLMQKEIYHRKIFTRPNKSSGTHRKEGIFILRGEGVRKNYPLEDAGISDIAPTILFLLGLPVPEDMDGKVIVDAFEKGYLREHSVEIIPSPEHAVAAGEGIMSEAETEKMKKALRDLGYFG